MATTTLPTDPVHRPSGRDAQGWDAGVREVHHVRWMPFRRREPGQTRDTLSGGALAVALSGLLILAVGMGYVSYRAQRQYVLQHKAAELAATIEALGLDVGAVIFACLAFAGALSGRAAVRARVGNLGCVAGSLGMNLMSATWTNLGSVAVWAMPALLYAFASDTLIGEIRLRALEARGQADAGSAFASLGRALVGGTLFTLRLAFDRAGTLGGFRSWVLSTAPVAPGTTADQLQPATSAPLPAGGPDRAPGRETPARTPSAERTERTTTKRALLLAAYGRLDDHGDPRTHRRECVAELARELAPEAAVNEGTARRYLHEYLTRQDRAA